MRELSDDAQTIIDFIKESETRRDKFDVEKHEENRKRIDAMQQTQRRIETEVINIGKGFPDGDPDAHRRYHESVIEWRELRNNLVREALSNAAKVGFFAGAAWVIYAIWVAFKMEVVK